MASSGTPMRYLHFDGLLNNGVSDFVMSDSELFACKNVWVYKIGKLEKVPGYTQSANDTAFQSGQALTFLHDYYDVEANYHYQLGIGYNGADAVLKTRSTGAWSAVKLTWNTASGGDFSAQNFLGKVFIVGNADGIYLSPATGKGTTYTTSAAADTDLLNMPKGRFITRYRDRLFVINCEVAGTIYRSRAYYSSVPEAGKITWNVLEDFFDFGYDDGDVLVGGGEAVDRLVLLKKNSVWKCDLSSVKKIADIGCDSYRSIKVIENTIYWFNRHGFWRWRGSGPELISERAKEYIDSIDPSHFDNVVAVEYYKKEYRAFIGDVVVNNVLYHNAWFCFDTMRERCYIRCTYHGVKSAANYIEDGKKRAYFGGETGNLYKFAEKADGVYSDAGKEIDSFFETRLLDHGVPEDVKFTNHMTVFTRHCHGMKVAADADNRGEFSIDNEDVLNKNVQQVEISASANRFRYRFYEKSDGLSWEFEGFVIETQIKEEAYPQ